MPNFIGDREKVFTHDYVSCDLNWYKFHLNLLKFLNNNHYQDAMEIEENVATLFVDVLSKDRHKDECNSKTPTIQQRKLVSRVKHCINQDLSTNLSLKDIADQAFSSPFHLSRIFKKITGKGINQYRNHQRLRIISLKLQQGYTDLASLAYEFGYSSHSHLSYCFKKYYGNTPSEFKKLIN